MVCLSRQYPFNFFKGYFPHILLGPLLNTLSHLILCVDAHNGNKIGTYEILILKIWRSEGFMTLDAQLK